MISRLKEIANKGSSPVQVLKKTYTNGPNSVKVEEVWLQKLDIYIPITHLEENKKLQAIIAGYFLEDIIGTGFSFSLTHQNLELHIDRYSLEFIPEGPVVSNRSFLEVSLDAWEKSRQLLKLS